MFFLVLVELSVRRNDQNLASIKVPVDQTILQFSHCKLVGSHGVKSERPVYMSYILPSLKYRMTSRRRSGVTEACSCCCERT